MNQRMLMLCVMLMICINSSFALAGVDVYEFNHSDAPSFLYTGGDLLVVNIAARLSGRVSISTDEYTSAAELRFESVIIYSAFSSTQTGEFLFKELSEYWTAEFYEGTTLTELDAFDFVIPGRRITPAEVKFGPSLSEGTNRYLQHFTFTADANSYRLTGGSFFSDDSPNYYIDGVLIPVPEPSTFGYYMAALACLANLRHHRSESARAIVGEGV